MTGRAGYGSGPRSGGIRAGSLATTGDPAFNRIWTLLRAPCISLPAATGAHGMPVGVQLVGAPGGDAPLLAAAAFVEEQLARDGRVD